MGQRRGEADAQIMQIVDGICAEFERTVRPKYVWREYELSVTDDTVTLGGITIKSKRLAAHLHECERAAVLAATLGIAADSIIQRSFTAGTLNGAAAQAVGAAMIESVCDDACAQIAAVSGLNIKPRFSAGYGDFDISHQQDMLNLTDAGRRAGITLSDSMMMIPTKSVTAVVGLTHKKGCAQGGCAQCDKKDCEFRV